MNEQAQVNDLLAQLPIEDIAATFGVDVAVAKDAVSKAVPGLLGGMAANATSGGQDALTAALQQHRPSGEAIIDIEDVNTKDGEKIVANVFGGKQDETIKALAGATDSSQAASLLPKLLPMIAPAVMAYLAGNLLGKKSESGKTSTKTSSKPTTTVSTKSHSSGSVTDLLGGMLGGIGVPDLGGLLGGGSSSSQSSGGLGAILGGLFGKK